MTANAPSPVRLFRRLPLEKRVQASHAFWIEEDGEQHAEALVALARHMKFRPQSVANLSADKLARYLAQLPSPPDAVAARALIAYHLTHQRPMMGAFLTALGIAHDDGLITEEQVPAPDAARLKDAAAQLAADWPAEDVAIYLGTLLSQDPDTWKGLDGLPQLQ